MSVAATYDRAQIRTALADFGCSEAQGWLFGRAISAEAVRSFLAMNNGAGLSSADSDQPGAHEPKRKNQRW